MKLLIIFISFFRSPRLHFLCQEFFSDTINEYFRRRQIGYDYSVIRCLLLPNKEKVMAIALTLQEFLDWENVSYTLINHPFTMSSLSTAEAAHVPADRLAKTVVLVDAFGFVMVVVPANQHVDLPRLRKMYNRNFILANEQEIADLFYDCEQGAIPALGEAYGFEMLVDDHLLREQEDIYIEGGDHCILIRLNGRDFQHLMAHAEHGHFCH